MISAETVFSFPVQYLGRGQITSGNGGSTKFGSSLVSQILWLPYQASAFRLLKKVDFFRSFFMNECKVDNVDLLLFIMKPVELISKLFTVVVCSVMSVTKGTYFLLFSLCRWSWFDVSGTVSSNMLSFFFAGLMITTSGLSLNLRNLMRKIS